MPSPRPTCPVHPQARLICPACLGAASKGRTSPRKADASAENAKKARAARAAKRQGA